MMRLLCLLLALATPAFAGRQYFFPNPTYTGYYSPGAVDRLGCVRVVAEVNITATKMAGRLSTTVAATGGVAIYADADAGAQMGEAMATTGGVATVNVTATGLSMTFVRGTRYRVCGCTTTATSTASLLASSFQAPATTRYGTLQNSGGVVIGTAANPCVSGNPPATTGAITADNTIGSWVVMVEE
jgi:hypothetical protein